MACVFTHLQIVLVQWVLRRSRLRRQRLPMKPSGRRFCYCLPCSASTIYGVKPRSKDPRLVAPGERNGLNGNDIEAEGCDQVGGG